MEVKEGTGKLYLGSSEKFIAEISYRLYEDLNAEPARWWGEFSIDRGVRIGEEDGYIVELEDGCRGKCFLRKLTNRVLPGIPARNVYRVNGVGLLKQG